MDIDKAGRDITAFRVQNPGVGGNLRGYSADFFIKKQGLSPDLPVRQQNPAVHQCIHHISPP
jgi:hypothetical protein